MKKRSNIIILIAMIIVASCLVGTIGIGHFLMPMDEPSFAEAIIVVSGGGEERLNKGIELYEEGYSDLLVLSGDALDPTSPSNAEVMKEQALEEGIPIDAILLDTESKTTFENARNVKKVLEEYGLKEPYSLILVTTEYHQRRLLQNFKEVYNDSETVTFINQPADVKYWGPNTWWLHKKGLSITVTECIKVLWGVFTGKMSGLE